MKSALAALLLCICAIASAKEIVAIGHGATQGSALQNAKREATDQVAGTFLMTRTDIDGDNVKESINEFSGGFIRSYKVLSMRTQDDLVEAIIKADVDEDKINTVIQSSGRAVSDSAIAALKNARSSYDKLDNALDVVMRDENKIFTTVKSIIYEVHGRDTLVTLNFQASWSPKWYDDMRTLAKASGPEVGPFDHKDFGVCFHGDRHLLWIDIECYDIHFNVDLPADINFSVLAKTQENATIDMGYVSIGAASLYYQYRNDFGDVMDMHKNGVLDGSITIKVDSQILEKIASFDITSNLNDMDTTSASDLCGLAKVSSMLKRKCPPPYE